MNTFIGYVKMTIILLNGKCHHGYITETRICNIKQFFTAEKNDNFQMKIYDFFIIFALNIDFGYTLEPPH